MASTNTPSSRPPVGADSSVTPVSDEEGGVRPPDSVSPPPRSPRAMALFSLWSFITPFFISAFLFLSAFFAVLSPLPLLVLRFSRGRAWAWGAVLANSVLVWYLGGRLSFALYFTFIAVLALVMAEMIQLRQSILRVSTVTLVGMAGAALIVVSYFAHSHQLGILAELNREVAWIADQVAASFNQNGMSPAVDVPEFEEWRQSLASDLPSGIAIFALVLVWANLSALLKLNPGGIREKMGLDASFQRTWKTPELLVWPTLVSGGLALFGSGEIVTIALNGFRILMAIYAIQGLSILSSCFDAWGVRGPFRMIGFLVSVFLMLPLLLGLGFFDLWFDFRSRIRQS